MDNIDRNFRRKSQLRRDQQQRRAAGRSATDLRQPNSDLGPKPEYRSPQSAGTASTPPPQPETPRTATPGQAPRTSRLGRVGQGLRTAAQGAGKALRFAAGAPGALIGTGAYVIDQSERLRSSEDIDRAFSDDPEVRGSIPDSDMANYGGGTAVDTGGQTPEWLRGLSFGEAEDPGSEGEDPTAVSEAERRALVSGDRIVDPGQSFNLGRYGSLDPEGDITGTADESGRVNQFRGRGTLRTPEQRMAEGREANARNLRALDIVRESNALREQRQGGGGISDVERTNRAFDARRNELRNLFEGNNTGSGRAALAQALNTLEGERNAALSNLRDNEGATERQRIASQASRDVAQTQAQGNLARERFKQSQLNYRDATKAQREQQAAQLDMSEDGYNRYNEAVESMFIDPETGEPDAVRQDSFRNFLETSDVFSPEEFMSMGPQKQAFLKREFERMFDMNERFNESTGGLPSESLDEVIARRESALGDVVNGTLSVVDYLRTFVGDDTVLETASGRTAVTEDIIENADDLRIVNDSILRNRGR